MELNSFEELVKKVQSLELEVNKLKKIVNFESNELQHQQVDSISPLFAEQEESIQQSIDKIQESIKILLDSGNSAFSLTTGRFKRHDGTTEGWMTAAKCGTIDELPEDKISEILEPFTNPRRIKVLKELYKSKLAANELSQKTGLVGGQLYHHLSILEKGKLISKEGDLYTLKSRGARVLFLLGAVAGDISGPDDI